MAEATDYGAAKVYVMDGAEFSDLLVLPKVDALARIAKAEQPAAVQVTPSSDEGKEVATRWRCASARESSPTPST